jgi:3-hydroxymyristoyl/3-hydroxydecanoyl-(acyl carrier protein) dehydratase
MQYSIAANHPSLPGHFPGHPLVPGVVLLSYVVDAVGEKVGRSAIRGIRRLKFLHPLSPSQNFRVEVAEPQAQKVGFRCWSGEVLLAEGQLALARQQDTPE